MQSHSLGQILRPQVLLVLREVICLPIFQLAILRLVFTDEKAHDSSELEDPGMARYG